MSGERIRDVDRRDRVREYVGDAVYDDGFDGVGRGKCRNAISKL